MYLHIKKSRQRVTLVNLNVFSHVYSIGFKAFELIHQLIVMIKSGSLFLRTFKGKTAIFDKTYLSCTKVISRQNGELSGKPVDPGNGPAIRITDNEYKIFYQG